MIIYQPPKRNPQRKISLRNTHSTGTIVIGCYFYTSGFTQYKAQEPLKLEWVWFIDVWIVDNDNMKEGNSLHEMVNIAVARETSSLETVSFGRGCPNDTSSLLMEYEKNEDDSFVRHMLALKDWTSESKECIASKCFQRKERCGGERVTTMRQWDGDCRLANKWSPKYVSAFECCRGCAIEKP